MSPLIRLIQAPDRPVNLKGYSPPVTRDPRLTERSADDSFLDEAVEQEIRGSSNYFMVADFATFLAILCFKSHILTSLSYTKHIPRIFGRILPLAFQIFGLSSHVRGG